MTPPIGKLRQNQKRREKERAEERRQKELRAWLLQQRREIDALLERRQANLDLGRYAGTYGGYVAEPLPPPTWWQRFKNWCHA